MGRRRWGNGSPLAALSQRAHTCWSTHPTVDVVSNGQPAPDRYTYVTSSRAAVGGPDAIEIHTERWRDLVPASAWPTGFAESGMADRSDVFAVADRWRTGTATAVQLATATLAWGYGVRGYGPYRTRRIVLQDPHGTQLEAALSGFRVAATVPVDVLREAYRRFRTTNHLHGLGPAFYTKILYFAGYRPGRGGVQPLILDRVVASRLSAAAGFANQYHTGWPPTVWLAYLIWAAEQARRPDFGGEPDQVEVALFTGNWRNLVESGS